MQRYSPNLKNAIKDDNFKHSSSQGSILQASFLSPRNNMRISSYIFWSFMALAALWLFFVLHTASRRIDDEVSVRNSFKTPAGVANSAFNGIQIETTIHSQQNNSQRHPWYSQKNLTTENLTTKIRLEDRYLSYSQGGDYCVGVSHYTWSLTCALGEAYYLNRTYVLDDTFCMHPIHNGGEKLDRPLELYFDLKSIQRYVKTISRSKFLRKVEEATKQNLNVTVLEVDSSAASPPLKNSSAQIIQRNLGSFYGYNVCEKEENKVIERNWKAFTYAPYLTNLASDICKEMSSNFDAVHIRRGDKAADRKRWPHLEVDTRPPKLVETLLQKIKRNRTLYVATNERNESIFYPLRAHYNLKLQSDFSTFWGENSKWWKAAMSISNSSPVFDAIMKSIVDYDIFSSGTVKLETFNDLTKDPKHGV